MRQLNKINLFKIPTYNFEKCMNEKTGNRHEVAK